MLRKLRPRSAYDVIALLALFVALGGTTYATATITGADVVDHSLTGADIKGKSPSTEPAENGTIRTEAVYGQPAARGLRQPFTLPPVSVLPETSQLARAAWGGGFGCPGTAPPFVVCPVRNNRGVAYIIKVAKGIYCVGVSGINAAQNVAAVSPVKYAVPNEYDASAMLHRSGSACVSNEFEIHTVTHRAWLVKPYGETGYRTVQGTPAFSDAIAFSIVIP
jgi:hypothetical protein